MSACTLELGCLTVNVYIWASNFEECPYIFFIFPLNGFFHSRDSQLTASSSYQPSLVGPSKVRSWMKGPSSAHPVSDIIREPVGCCNLQQWRWSLSKSISCTEQLNNWPCHSLAHRSSDWMKFWQKSNLLYMNPKEIAEKYEKALRHIPVTIIYKLWTLNYDINESYKTYRERHWTTCTMPCNVFDYDTILCKECCKSITHPVTCPRSRIWDACIKAVTRGCHHLPK